MLILLYFSIIIMMISIIMMSLATILSKKSFMDREKSSPFECGFNPKYLARMPFSMHFFLITIIFLIFDVEIALIFPMIYLINIVNFYLWMKISFFFIFILLLGLYHEWNNSMLNWTN